MEISPFFSLAYTEKKQNKKTQKNPGASNMPNLL